MKVVLFMVYLLVKIAPWYFLFASIKAMGWGIAIEEGSDEVEGLTIGTEDYMNRHIPPE